MTRRRLGVATAVCHACLTPNGVALGLNYYSQAALYKCCNPECGKFNRIVVESQEVHLNSACMESAQKGVRVGP